RQHDSANHLLFGVFEFDFRDWTRHEALSDLAHFTEGSGPIGDGGGDVESNRSSIGEGRIEHHRVVGEAEFFAKAKVQSAAHASATERNECVDGEMPLRIHAGCSAAEDEMRLLAGSARHFVLFLGSGREAE